MAAILGALRVIGGGLFLPVVLVGGSRDGVLVVTAGVDLSWRALKFRFLRIGVVMTTEL